MPDSRVLSLLAYSVQSLCLVLMQLDPDQILSEEMVASLCTVLSLSTLKVDYACQIFYSLPMTAHKTVKQRLDEPILNHIQPPSDFLTVFNSIGVLHYVVEEQDTRLFYWFLYNYHFQEHHVNAAIDWRTPAGFMRKMLRIAQEMGKCPTLSTYTGTRLWMLLNKRRRIGQD